jgi:uncharacterized membrane protein
MSLGPGALSFLFELCPPLRRYSIQTEAIMDSAAGVSLRVTPGRWISSGWRLVKEDLGSFVLMTLIVLALSAIGHVVVAGPLCAGLFIAVRRRMVEGRTEFADVFAGFGSFVDTLLIGLLSSFFLLLGIILFFFPVFLVAALYLFPCLFVIDRKLPFWDAMEASRKLALRNLAGYLGFVLLLAILNLAGLALFGVGVLVTIPVSVGAIAVAYRDVAGFALAPPAGTRPIVIA